MQSMIKQALSLGLLGLLATGCSDDKDRQEVVSKLRALGAGANPLVPVASEGMTLSTTKLTVYAALPIGETVTASVFKDSDSVASIPLETTAQIIDSASQTYTNYKGIALYSLDVLLTAPQLAVVDLLGSKVSGSGKFRYGIKLVSGGEEEKIVGDVLVYPATAPEHNWKSPTVDIAAPAQGASLKLNDQQDIQATITDSNSENIKLGWFVSKGEITNRRAKTTKWKVSEAGEQTLIVTVHGKKSKGFGIKAVTVTSAE